MYEVDKFSAITEFVHAHMQENKQKYVLAFCNRKLCELGKLLDRDVELKLVEKTSVIGMDTYKRSLTFLMVKAFSDVMGSGYSVKVMYSLGKGYYCRLLKNFREGDRMVPEVLEKLKEFKIKEGSEIHVIQNDASGMMIIASDQKRFAISQDAAARIQV